VIELVSLVTFRWLWEGHIFHMQCLWHFWTWDNRHFYWTMCTLDKSTMNGTQDSLNFFDDNEHCTVANVGMNRTKRWVLLMQSYELSGCFDGWLKREGHRNHESKMWWVGLIFMCGTDSPHRKMGGHPLCPKDLICRTIREMCEKNIDDNKVRNHDPPKNARKYIFRREIQLLIDAINHTPRYYCCIYTLHI
jgi:hypothetical protein